MMIRLPSIISCLLVLQELKCVLSQKRESPEFDVNLQVLVPQNLEREHGYVAVKSNIGTFPKDGFKIRGIARYFFGNTKAFGDEGLTPGYSTLRDGQPFIAVVKASPQQTTFVQQVREVQQMGAVAVIGVATTNSGTVYGISGYSNCETRETCRDFERMIVGDGWAGDITIPVGVSFLEDIKDIENYMNDQRSRESTWRSRLNSRDEKKAPFHGEMLRLEISFSLRKDIGLDAVKYEFWTLPGEQAAESLHFLKTFKPIASMLDSKAFFTPRFAIFDGFQSGCRQDSGDNRYYSNNIPRPSWCSELCVYDGHYCAYHPEPPLYPTISGADVVKETIRQSCIKSQYATTTGGGLNEAWWDYSIHFLEHCAQSPVRFNNTECINKAYDAAGIDASKINLCIQYTRDDAHESNSLLNAELLAVEDRKVTSVPSSYVDQSKVQGGLDAENLFREICSQFSPQSLPEICHKCQRCRPKEALQCIYAADYSCADSTENAYESTQVSEIPHTTAKATISRSTPASPTGMYFFLVLLLGLCGGAIIFFGQKRKFTSFHFDKADKNPLFRLTSVPLWKTIGSHQSNIIEQTQCQMKELQEIYSSIYGDPYLISNSYGAVVD